jgi:hypothetical protein
VLVAVPALLLTLAAPSEAFPAGSPSGCSPIATGIYFPPGTWSNVCFVSTSTSVTSELTSGVQAFLILNHYSPGTWDKAFGSNTRNAVIAFQRDNGLSADGVVGPDTWNTIEARINDNTGACFQSGPFGPYCYLYVILGTATYVLYLSQVGFVNEPWGVIDPSGHCMNYLATYVASC